MSAGVYLKINASKKDREKHASEEGRGVPTLLKAEEE